MQCSRFHVIFVNKTAAAGEMRTRGSIYTIGMGWGVGNLSCLECLETQMESCWEYQYYTYTMFTEMLSTIKRGNIEVRGVDVDNGMYGV